ncbi:hypothetical protein JCM4814A_90010 [Streptomyces phaeofaciens JCM 4814]|uniref:Uncharacterized protein n=1 Tax=Streptomyces phaeofaciens TaxID=68254 RepID=A0A918LZ43_9ACTN|nr:hypothetical protein GCM10010226_68470 [Streptomyces phaeofaciens]
MGKTHLHTATRTTVGGAHDVRTGDDDAVTGQEPGPDHPTVPGQDLHNRQGHPGARSMTVDCGTFAATRARATP